MHNTYAEHVCFVQMENSKYTDSLKMINVIYERGNLKVIQEGTFFI
jgi:hypothetical protein